LTWIRLKLMKIVYLGGILWSQREWKGEIFKYGSCWLKWEMWPVFILAHSAELSVYLDGLTDFDCGLFRSPNMDTLNLTTDIWIWNAAQGGCDWSAGDAHSSAAPDPTFAFVGGPCCPTLDFVIAFWIMITFYTLLTSLFCID
jgi:hypothetical protein